MGGSVSLATDLHLKFGDAPLEAEELLLKSSFLTLEGGDLLLDTTVFCLLEVEVSLPEWKQGYISSSIRTSSLLRLFLTSAVFMVRTDSRVSFSLRRICTSFLWLLSSLEMLLICCCVTHLLPPASAACPSARQGLSRNYFLYRSSINICQRSFKYPSTYNSPSQICP